MGSYIYTPLSAPKEIRLVTIWPGDSHAPMKVDIRHAALSQSLDYEALSYVWGEPNRCDSITVSRQPEDGSMLSSQLGSGKRGIKTRLLQSFSRLRHSHMPSHQLDERAKPTHSRGGMSTTTSATLPVTRNLSTALRYLRDPLKPRVLWIDAICINQDDFHERGHEVGHMEMIFRKARHVIAWFGPGDDKSALAISTLKSIGRDVELEEGAFRLRVVSGSVTEELQDDYDAVTAMSDSWIAVRDLLSHSWFTRLWIYQEIALSTDAVLMVGHLTIQWRVFKCAFYWLWTEATHFSPVSDYFAESLMSRIAEFTARGSAGDFGNSSLDLLPAVKATTRCLCYDPRDRVYGILSLLSNHYRKNIEVDYSRSCEEVYEDLMIYCAQENERMELLRFCTIRESSSPLKLPSWVPDLSVPNLTSFLEYCGASGYSPNESRYNSTDDFLQIRGLHSATIAQVYSAVPHSAHLRDILAICHSWEPPELLSASYVGGGSLLDAFIITLICGYFKEAVPANQGPFLLFEECQKAYFDCVRERKLNRDTAYYTMYLETMLPGRRFFKTQEGYIGLCPESARPGDQIMVIIGIPSPLLLRPVPTTGGRMKYQLVGECFVHGMMWAEVFLGQLPPGWERRYTTIHGIDYPIFLHEGRSTQQDPRLGPLPQGWRIGYGQKVKGKDHCDEEFDDKGNMRHHWFEFPRTGEWSWTDPRLSSKALKKRGLQIQNFAIV